MVSPSDSIIFLYLGIAMVNYQMYQWDPVFIAVTFFLCLFVRSDNIQNADSIEEFDIAEPSALGCSRRLSTTIEKEWNQLVVVNRFHFHHCYKDDKNDKDDKDDRDDKDDKLI